MVRLQVEVYLEQQLVLDRQPPLCRLLLIFEAINQQYPGLLLLLPLVPPEDFLISFPLLQKHWN